MAAIHCNGVPVLKLRLHAPIAAAWVADVEAASDQAITGAVKLSDGRNEWRGTALRSGVVAGVSSVTVVGGAGGLRKELTAKSYVGVVARQVVQDIVGEAGETLSQKAITTPALRTVLQHWTRVGSTPGAPVTAGEQLASVIDAIGATWRVLADGSVWVGEPTFAASRPTGLVLIEREPARARVRVELDGLDLLPDTTVEGDRVGDVEYVVDRGIRATYWLEAA